MRKRPLAAQTDDDSFTARDWNTTINYGTLHVESRQYQTTMQTSLSVILHHTNSNVIKYANNLTFVYVLSRVIDLSRGMLQYRLQPANDPELGK